MLRRSIDYAGLFPPAALSMPQAVANYADYRQGEDEWLLGRFIVPASRLKEFVSCRAKLPPAAREYEFDMSVLMGPDYDQDVRLLRKFLNRDDPRTPVRTMELKAATLDEVNALPRITEELPEVFCVYVEIPFDAPAEVFQQVSRFGLCGKMRTGGVTANAFPSPQQIIRFMRECVDAALPFKATAGLHHPLRGDYRVTYDADAPRACMFGFLNVFLAAALLSLHATEEEALAVLTETDPSAISIESEAIRWRDVRITNHTLYMMHMRLLGTFGSCSFTEPVDELRELGLLA